MLVCPHTLQRLKRCFRTAETHKRYDYNSSHVRSQSFATEQWQSALSQVQSAQRWVELNNAVSRINVAILGVFLDPVYQRMQNSTNHAFQNHVCWQGGIFTSSGLESLSSPTGQQKKESAGRPGSPGLPHLPLWRQISQIWLLLETVGVKKIVSFFPNIWLFWGQLARAIRLVSSLFKYLAKCYQEFLDSTLCIFSNVICWQPIEE